ncbi:putative tRNA-splicing endonuclease subunit tsp-2 [Paramyrothecium foliicola]|nr:putative tRNA-splicing endonuclease subunit tsp-2 [Paramyrothecium foliicola]
MAEMQTISQDGPVNGHPQKPASMTNGKPGPKRGPPLHQIYALPAPIRTFPLPTFYPNNPVSVFHVAYAWLQQVFRPPATEPSVVHHGVWSAGTTSVHVTDEQSMRALWQQGFYGKGSLSRSEPNWLKREEVRRGIRQGQVSEIITVQRREDRAQAKWERARLEQEAIRQIRLSEAQQTVPEVSAELTQAALAATPFLAPVGPLELLALPNSAVDLVDRARLRVLVNSDVALEEAYQNGDVASFASRVADGNSHKLPGLATLRNALINQKTGSSTISNPNGAATTNGLTEEKPRSGSLSPSSDSTSEKTVKRRKSVRFSPTVESTTFEALDPPSPNPNASKPPKAKPSNGNAMPGEQEIPPASLSPQDEGNGTPQAATIVNKEHLQLMPEEAFFLTFGLGALVVKDPVSGKPMSPMELFTLFRQYSYFPPRVEADEPELQPDDNFLVHYAVYHHFRSLGWVPRAGIKFGVDWLLYTRGPVFDHAEFGLIVIPSYSDPLWAASGKMNQRKTWQWMHSIVRVLAHVTKSLVFVYVDIPPPSKFDEALKKGFVEVFEQYKVREVMIKRWSSNRNR